MLFEEKYSASQVWEMIERDKESVKGKHHILKFLFADLDEPYYAISGNKGFVVSRNVHKTLEGTKITFSIFTRETYNKSEWRYMKEKLDKFSN